ncbi:hypothetical protein TUA1478L_05880 [Lactiplantibacillus plantarum]
MSKVLKHAIIYTGLEKIDDGYIRFGKEIEAVGPMDDYVAQPDDDIEFVSGKTIVPGFIDVHSHGGYSFDSMDGNPAEINEMVNDMVAREGITSYFCTTMTQSNENLDHSMAGINKAADENPVIQGFIWKAHSFRRRLRVPNLKSTLRILTLTY